MMNNIKKIIILLMTFCMAFFLMSCGGNNPPAGTPSTDAAVTDATQSADVSLGDVLNTVKSQVTLPDSMVDFDAKRLQRVFGITEEQAADFAGCIAADGLRQDEIIFVRAKDEAAAADIAQRLQNDWQSKYDVIMNYDPTQAAIIEAAKVETEGLFVSLVISEERDAVMNIFHEAIR